MVKQNTSNLSGVRNVYTHQVVIALIIHGFIQHFKATKKYSKYIATPETSFSSDDLTTPDILIWKLKSNPTESVLVMELCHDYDLQNEVDKLTNIMREYSSIKESFVYTMESNMFYKLKRLKNNSPSKPKIDDKSELFKLNFSKFINI